MRIIGRTMGRVLATTTAVGLCLGIATTSASAISLKEAMSVAVDSNPDIGEAIENRQAQEFELRQGLGLLLPSVDVEASAGKRKLSNESRRDLDIDDDPLFPNYGEVVVTQMLFDGGRARAEIDFQASQVDSASYGVLERSIFISLQVANEYIRYLGQREVIRVANAHIANLQGITGDIQEGIEAGALLETDRQQAQERIINAQTERTFAEQTLEESKARFYELVGMPLANASMPPSMYQYWPKSLDEAIGLARTNNPRVHLAKADIDAADANVARAKADYLPEVVAEGRARKGHDIDGNDGETTDLLGRVVLRWNLYRGGIKKANEQEQVHRASEQRMLLHQINRDLEKITRTAWETRAKQLQRAELLRRQVEQNARIVSSYREQFAVGQRSLLDVLDAENTRFNTEIRYLIASYGARYEEYKLLAATGQLLEVLGIQPPEQSDAYARAEFLVPPTLPAEVYERVPSRQYNFIPMDLLAPIRTR